MYFNLLPIKIKKSLSVFPRKEIQVYQDQFDLTLNLHLGGKLSRKRHQLS